jgi:hypothetical protein
MGLYMGRNSVDSGSSLTGSKSGCRLVEKGACLLGVDSRFHIAFLSRAVWLREALSHPFGIPAVDIC